MLNNKKQLHELSIITGTIDDISSVNINMLKNHVLSNWTLNNRLSDNDYKFEHDYSKVPYHQHLQWVQDYIRDHYRIEYGQTLCPTPVNSVAGGFEFIGTGFTGSIDNVSVKEIIGNQGTSGEPLLRTADTNEPRIEYDADGREKDPVYYYTADWRGTPRCSAPSRRSACPSWTTSSPKSSP